MLVQIFYKDGAYGTKEDTIKCIDYVFNSDFLICGKVTEVNGEKYRIESEVEFKAPTFDISKVLASKYE